MKKQPKIEVGDLEYEGLERFENGVSGGSH